MLSHYFDHPANIARKVIVLFAALILLFDITACRRKSSVAKEATITVYGFSVVKEPLENAIFPAFKQDWFKKTGQQIIFEPSYAGSEIVTNQIVSGVEADVAILAIERNADRLVRPDVTTHEWRKMPYGGIINRTPMVIVVRQGNPKGVRDFSDLGKPGIRLIQCDPISSGAGQWSLLAIYGSELIKSEKKSGVRDDKRAFQVLDRIWRNVISTQESARAARTQFERGEGDALVTYELEALQMIDKRAPVEIVMPQATILSEHPVVIINHVMSPAKYALVELFVRYLWEHQSQEAWVKAFFRSVTDEKLNERFQKIEIPFTAADLGGWSRAYPEIVDGIWKQKIQTRK